MSRRTTLPIHRAQLPLKLRRGAKREVRGQFAALCWRVTKTGKVKICLVTSRRRGRWILPKGWPMPRETPARAAATEAWEEAGIKGRAFDICLGVYAYTKMMRPRPMPVVVMVYPVQVKSLADDWPEAHQRRRKWFSPRKAAQKLKEPELKRIVARFDPSVLKEYLKE